MIFTIPFAPRITSMRSSSGTRGASSNSTVKNTVCSWTILLCFRLCRKALGQPPRDEEKNTAAPGTRGTSAMSRLSPSRVAFGAASFLARMMSMPRRQVVSTVNTTVASAIGNQPPCSSFAALAAKNASSTTANSRNIGQSMRSRALPANGSTISIIVLVISRSPATAMP